MTVTPYDFYHVTSLSFEGTIINLNGMMGIQLGINMLGRKYSTKTIHYFDLVSDYMLLPQKTTKERVCMARVFFLHLLGLTFLPMVGKRCPWGGWPSPRTLERHEGPTVGKHVFPIFTPPLTLLAEAPCNNLWGLGSSLRLVLSIPCIFICGF